MRINFLAHAIVSDIRGRLLLSVLFLLKRLRHFFLDVLESVVTSHEVRYQGFIGGRNRRRVSVRLEVAVELRGKRLVQYTHVIWHFFLRVLEVVKSVSQ